LTDKSEVCSPKSPFMLVLWHIQDYVTQHVIGAHTTGLRSPNHVP